MLRQQGVTAQKPLQLPLVVLGSSPAETSATLHS
jgi:hypothetical protein